MNTIRPNTCTIKTFLFLCATLCFVCKDNATFAQTDNLADTNAVLQVTQITSGNVAALKRQGPDAIGGIGDWFFTNGTLCAVISDVDHEGEFSTKGGSLVDLGFCGRQDDHFSFTHDLLQGSRKRPLDTRSIRTELSQEVATVIVNGERDGVNIETHYRLFKNKPSELHINKQIRQSSDAQEFNFFSPLIFNLHSLEPFVFNRANPTQSNGFNAVEFSTKGVSAMRKAAINADTIITLSPAYRDKTAVDPISYGWHLASAERVEAGERTALPNFMLADATSTAMLILTDDFYIGDGKSLSWFQLPQIPLLSLNEDSHIETHEIIYVGAHNDVAAITDQFWSDGATVSGRINTTNSGIHVYSESGQALSFVRPDNTGMFEFKVPSNLIKNYQLVAKASANRVVTKNITVNDKNSSLKPITMPEVATILLPRGEAMRLVFVGINGTKTPDFADQFSDFTVHDEGQTHRIKAVNNIFLAGQDSDLNELELAAGEYRVYATKGPEFSLEKITLRVDKTGQQTLNIPTPTRSLSTPNYIASDLHVHSGLSFDNAFSELERVRSFVAEHGEVMVSSEHDLPVDYAPRIAELGVEGEIVSIPAAEVTSLLPTKLNPFTNGHANFFPYEPNKQAYRNGMINHENKRWREVIHDIKQSQTDVIVQMNHPRGNLALSDKKTPKNWKEIVDDGHFLDHMGSGAHPYNPHKPLHTHPNNTLIQPHHHTGLRDIDFDLMEVINPGGILNSERIKAQRLDWLSFVKQGEKIVGTANSDSHHANEQVALPRTMVAMTDDRVANFNQKEFLQSLKSGNAYGTTGPMLNISLSGAEMGQTFKGQRGQLKVDIKTTDWMRVNKLKIQINGDTVDEYTLNSTLEHDFLVPLAFEKDSFVTIEVEGPASPDYQTVYPNLTPYAFSNPIYVDFDSDGKWQAPGL